MIVGIDASRAQLEHKTGTEWYSFYVIQELKKIIPSDVEVRLYAKEPLVGPLAELPPHWSVRVLKWPPRLLWTQLRLSLEMLFHPVDVLYISAHTVPCVGGKKNIAVIHDVGFFRNPELYTHSELRYHRFAFRLALQKSDKIITISEFSKKEIHAVAPQVEASRINVIYNGFVAREQESPGASHSQRVTSILDANIPYILTLGRVEEKKNMLRAIESFAVLKKNFAWTGHMVCAGALGFGAERIMARIQELGIEDSIHILGWRSEEDVSTLLHHAAVFFFPTLYEGFGMPVLEAMHASVPVVCSDIPPLREIAGSSAVFVDPQDVGVMAKALHRVVTEEPQDQERMSRITSGQKRAAEFSWQKTALATWNSITSL